MPQIKQGETVVEARVRDLRASEAQRWDKEQKHLRDLCDPERQGWGVGGGEWQCGPADPELRAKRHMPMGPVPEN